MGARIRGTPISTRKRHIEELRSLARSLQAQKLPGVEIWVALMRHALDQNRDLPVSAASKMDNIIQNMAIVTVGREAYHHLGDYRAITRRMAQLHIPGSPSAPEARFVDRFLAELKLLGGDHAAAIEPLDTHHGADFKPQLNDQSANQIKHTFFYHFMGYVTRDDFGVVCGSLLHEIRDEGSSAEDHHAGIWGSQMGIHMRLLRQKSPTARTLESLPALIGAAYGRNGADYGHPNLNGGLDFRAEASAVHRRVQQGLQKPGWSARLQTKVVLPVGRSVVEGYRNLSSWVKSWF